MKKKVSVPKKENSAPIPIAKLDLGFGSRYLGGFGRTLNICNHYRE